MHGLKLGLILPLTSVGLVVETVWMRREMRVVGMKLLLTGTLIEVTLELGDMSVV